MAQQNGQGGEQGPFERKGPKFEHFNTISVEGFLGRDPEMRFTSTGASVTTFSLACSRPSRVEGRPDHTTWYTVEIWGRENQPEAGLAGLVNKALVKGSHVIVHGRHEEDTWQDQEGQSRRKSMIKNVTQIRFLGRLAPNFMGVGVGEAVEADPGDMPL